ncbi:MAG: caspase family protein, partial [Candidatus Cloacimonetes bacterium]|nr:caspase family protein [Candidatus Cloacimonadota bacterium]
MKRYLMIIITLIPILLFSYTIEETLSQIESLKKELARNEQIVEEKISNLRKSNPLFAEQDPFESSGEYAARLKKGQPIIDNIRKQYLDDLNLKIRILRGRMFETKNIDISLGNYNPDTQIYPMTISHLDYEKEIFNVNIDIGRQKAKLLYQNWDKVNKTGILTIDVGDKIGLAKIQLNEPISGFDYQYEFQPMISLNFPDDVYNIYSATFSPDSRIIAVGLHTSYGSNGSKPKYNIYLYDVVERKGIKTLGSDEYGTQVHFSKNSKYVFGEWRHSSDNLVYDLTFGVIYKNVKKIDQALFKASGEFLCVLDETRMISSDGRYEIKLEGTEKTSFGDDILHKEVNVYRTFKQAESDVLAEKVITRPPSLSANVSFSEPSGNQYLDALERGEIELTVTNSGKGPGKGLSIKFDPERIEGLNYNNSYIEEIPANESVTVKIPIEAYIDVSEADYILRVNFDEINGFPPAPVEIGFSTKAYLKPELFIVDVGIEDNNKNGMIESGETTKLTVRIGNKGKGIATGAYAKFYSEDNVFITDSYPKIVSLGDLEYNQHLDIPLEFFVNDKAADEIPLYIDLTEATGISGIDHLRIPILKSERTREIKRTVIAGIDKDYGDLDFKSDLSVDVEQNIPEIKKKNSDAIAVVLGIENYRNVSDVNFAFRDATIMKEYFSKTIGIPEENIYFRTNDEVTLGEFRKIFSDKGWLDKRVIENKTDVYFYYAGHGAPAIKEEKAFLIPFDGDPNYPVQTGYSLETVYENLSNLKANSVTVFLDACFTGANRENEMLLADARPVSIKLKNNYVNNVTVFSATSSNEISSSYPQNKHGLFSYFLMKGMQGDADE